MRPLAENPARQKIVEKARKIATMPFKEEIPKNIEQELSTLKKEIKKVDEKPKK